MSETSLNVKLSGVVNATITAESEQDLFKGVARVREIFGHTVCGRCKTENADYVCRRDKDENDWIEMVCRNPSCKAKLSFGSVKGKEAKLFPKVRWDNLSETQQEHRRDDQKFADEHNGFLPNGGWFVYKSSVKK